MLVALGGVVGTAGSAFSDSSQLPASDSSHGVQPAGPGRQRRRHGDHRDHRVGHPQWFRAVPGGEPRRIEPMLASVARVEGVKSVISPFTAGGRETGQC